MCECANNNNDNEDSSDGNNSHNNKNSHFENCFVSLRLHSFFLEEQFYKNTSLTFNKKLRTS